MPSPACLPNFSKPSAQAALNQGRLFRLKKLRVGYSAMLTPSGRLLRRSAHPEDRPAIFAAQFALSHACWLVAYPLAGLLMTLAGSPRRCWVWAC